MAAVKFNPALGIQSISGKLGNVIFYTRNGKQYVRRADKNNNSLRGIIEPGTSFRFRKEWPPPRKVYRAVHGPTTSHHRAIHESNPVQN